MKPNTLTATVSSVSSTLTALPTAKIVRHPQAKKVKGSLSLTSMTPPDEETIQRLNSLAGQHPFSVRHKGKNSTLL